MKNGGKNKNRTRGRKEEKMEGNIKDAKQVERERIKKKGDETTERK